MRLLLLFSLALFSTLDRASAQSTSPFEMDPPIEVEQYHYYWDGATLALRLKDASEKRLWAVVSQYHFESPVPHNTLFLDAHHYQSIGARLPLHIDEYQRTVDLIRLAATNERAVAAAEESPESDVALNLAAAKSVLRRLGGNSEPAHYEPGHTKPPAWYATYDAERKREYEERLAEKRADERFKSFYPEAGRACFEVPDDEGGMVTFGAEDRSGPATAMDADESAEDRAMRLQAERLAELVGDPLKLAEITCRAFGSIGGHPGHFVYRDFVAERAMRTVKPEDLVAALPRIEDDREALLGASRVLFEMGYDAELAAEDWDRWGPLIVKVALTEGPDDRKHEIVGWIAGIEYASVNALLLGIGSGDIGAEPDLDQTHGEEPGLSASAYLGLAIRGDESVRQEVLDSLATELAKENLAALEVCLALLGDPSYIKAEHFEVDSSSIGFAALRAIQRYEGRHGMDVLMSAALDHGHAVVANEAMSVAEWLTGQQWQPPGSRSQARNFKEKAKAWWEKYGEDYKRRKLGEAQQ